MSELVNGSAVLIGTFENGSDEWHAARANGLGGSDISKVVALNPYESRFSLYYQKKDKLRPIEENSAMYWGTTLEPVIFEEFRTKHLRKGLTMTTGDTFHHKDRLWQIANPDGLMWNGTELVDLLEIKTAGKADRWGKDGSDIIPIEYRCQIAHYCDVMGLEGGILRVLICGNDPRTYRIKPTTEDIEYLRDQGAQFMYELENNIEPNLDDHTATYNALKEMHPDIDGTVIQISSKLADAWWDTKDALDAAKEKHQGVKNQMAQKMGLARVAMCGDEKVAYRQRPSSGYGDPFVKSATRKVEQTNIAPVKAA